MSTQNTMTIQQVAEVLGVTVRTIRNAIQELRKGESTCTIFPPMKKGRGNQYHLNIEQVTLISQQVKRAHNTKLAKIPTELQPQTALERKRRPKDGAGLLSLAMETLMDERQQMLNEIERLKQENHRLTNLAECTLISVAAIELEIADSYSQARLWLESVLRKLNWQETYTAGQSRLFTYPTEEAVAAGYLVPNSHCRNNIYQEIRITLKGMAALREYLHPTRKNINVARQTPKLAEQLKIS